MSYDLFTAVGSAPQVEKDGSMSSKVSLSLNLESIQLAKYLSEASFYDQDIAADLVKAAPETKQYILEHLGDKALVSRRAGGGKDSGSRVDRVFDPVPALGDEEQEGDDGEAFAAAISLNPIPMPSPTAKIAANDDRYSTSMASKNGGRFDMITTWSQWLMNKGLAVAYGFDFTRWDLTLSDSDAGYEISAALDPSMFVIDVESQQPPLPGGQRGFFLTRFSGGASVLGPHTCTLRSSVTGKSSQFDTAGWRWGWAAPVTRSFLVAGSEEWDEVKENLEIPASAADSHYKISKIFFDLENALVSSDKAHTIVPNVPEEFQESFEKLQTAWRHYARDNDHHILGYAVVATTASEKHLGTFPPTSLQLQNYPFLSAATTKPTTSTDKHGESNMFQMLYKTDLQAFPSDPALPWTGNWCHPDLSGADGTLGSMAISNELFLDDFVVPKLVAFNRATHLESLAPTVTHKGGTKWSFTFRWGSAAHPESFFEWKPASLIQMAALRIIYGNGIGWTWSTSSHQSTSKQVNGAGRFTATHDVTMSNILYVPRGSNKVVLVHTMSHHLFTSHRWVWTDKSSATVKRSCITELTLRDVLEGRLGMEIPKDLDVKVEILDRKGTWLGQNYVAGVANAIAKSLKDEQRLAAAVKQINDRLSGPQVFVLPGGGHLFLKNPVFNGQGDLLLTLDFNGQQQRKNPPGPAKDRKSRKGGIPK
ncbi:hypothetical protein GGTG_09223 [Gaeumannomyces tritici R3-111a-1]|uniref:Uncharacterized protein n=1 Tax=Gaeumannomyces tritici (strain R3-111a-1) TaxID=644352 RepID=J3P6T1_GAET3|nr:hypothetical protein GGTG_09223 [Gaeumannomyces tritici R3-111a-1]EJT72357.1 hypothetical protein GGTG_09223 [Gaeumannomyces tritici R3-111a-1]